jgi:hypothetical protein
MRALLLVLLLAGAEKSRAEQTLEAEGYTDVKMTGTAIVGCDKEDSMLTSKTFEATAPGKSRVKGRVCCGLWLRGCRVRLDVFQ